MKNTALTAIHESLGAKMVPFAGYNMPVQYEGVNAEHEIVRTGVGVFDVSHMGEFFLKGENALALIQKVTSNDASKLVDGKAQYSCLPNNDGGIVDKTWYKFEQGLGGQNQTDLESFALKQCETKHKQACVVLIYNENYDRCRFTFNEAYVRALSFSEEAKQADALNKQAVQKQKEIELQ